MLKLTYTERLILRNQARILEKLYPDESQFHRQMAVALEEGYTLYYEPGSELWEEMPEDEQRFVLDVLTMYRELKVTYDDLEDKEGLDKDSLVFEGFDGNAEDGHYAFTRFLVDEARLYSELKNKSFNSHYPASEKYRPMVARWRQLKVENRDRLHRRLSKEEIISILEAGKP